MLLKNTNTIFAHSSGRGKSGVAIFRISGPESGKLAEEITGKRLDDFKPRYLHYCKIYDPFSGKLIDEGMVVYFKNGSSFTGEDALEIHLHGSLAVIQLMHKTLFKLDYLRQAEAGEFTKRAFLNGKFDLTSAEGIADLIDAETEMQHQQAIRQLGGGLHKLYESWRQDLITIMAMIEAYIDFPDEEIPEEAIDRANRLINSLRDKITDHLKDNRNGERLRGGLKLAIMGRPNVGKSSLLNYLMQRDIAIVSEIAGTTRDVIEGHLDIGGYPIILQDTAGIRISDDKIEQLGINKAKEIQEEADIKIIVLDIEKDKYIPEEFIPLIDLNTLIIINKADLVGSADLSKAFDKGLMIDHLYDKARAKGEARGEDEAGGKKDILMDNMIFTSTKNKQGLDRLLVKITSIAENIASPSENPQITRQRHRMQLEKASKALEQFSLSGDLVMAAEDLRMTIRYLSNITGDITVEEILGEIFSSFCIGK